MPSNHAWSMDQHHPSDHGVSSGKVDTEGTMVKYSDNLFVNRVMHTTLTTMNSMEQKETSSVGNFDLGQNYPDDSSNSKKRKYNSIDLDPTMSTPKKKAKGPITKMKLRRNLSSTGSFS